MSTKTFFEQEIDRLAEKYGLPQHYYIHIRQSKEFMERHYPEKIELDKIAAAAFMSRFHYIRIFQQVYGKTPRQYLRDIRIENAKKLLKKGLPVSQVCTDVGYDSLPTFSKVFKRGTGLSPKFFREQHIRNRE